MINKSDTARSEDEVDKPEQLDQLQEWAGWLDQAEAIGSDLVQLLQLELRLALSSSKRLLMLVLLFVPVLILAWLGCSVLLAWQVYLFNMSVTQGLLGFFIVQLLGLAAITVSWDFYKKSLSLPLTRQHIRRLIEGENNDA